MPLCNGADTVPTPSKRDSKRASTSPGKKRQSVKRKSSTADVEEKQTTLKNEKLKALFRQFDTDGNGTMSRKELEVVMTKLGKFNGREISRVMDDVDKNNDGVIQFEEFVDWMTGKTGTTGSAPGLAPVVESKSAMAFDFEAVVRPLFAIWDRNGSGTISFDEFKECHAIMNSALNAAAEKAALQAGMKRQEQVVTLVAGHEESVWRAADSDGDAEVNLSEFCAWLRSSVEHAELELDRIVELITQLTLLLQNVLASSGHKGLPSSADLVQKLGECGSRLFRRASCDNFKDDSHGDVDAELWRQLPGPDSREELISKHMEEVLPGEGILKTEVSVKNCIPTGTKDSIRLLCEVYRTSIYRTRQGDVPPGQPVREQYFYASDGKEWQGLGKDGTEFFKSADELGAEMRLYARMHAAADFKEHISWQAIQEVLEESLEIGLFTKEDLMCFNASIDRALNRALVRQESIDEMIEESERREKAKSILPEVPFNVLEVMAELSGLNVIRAQPLWAGIKFKITLP